MFGDKPLLCFLNEFMISIASCTYSMKYRRKVAFLFVLKLKTSGVDHIKSVVVVRHRCRRGRFEARFSGRSNQIKSRLQLGTNVMFFRSCVTQVRAKKSLHVLRCPVFTENIGIVKSKKKGIHDLHVLRCSVFH